MPSDTLSPEDGDTPSPGIISAGAHNDLKQKNTRNESDGLEVDSKPPLLFDASLRDASCNCDDMNEAEEMFYSIDNSLYRKNPYEVEDEDGNISCSCISVEGSVQSNAPGSEGIDDDELSSMIENLEVDPELSYSDLENCNISGITVSGPNDDIGTNSPKTSLRLNETKTLETRINSRTSDSMKICSDEDFQLNPNTSTSSDVISNTETSANPETTAQIDLSEIFGTITNLEQRIDPKISPNQMVAENPKSCIASEINQSTSR